MGGHPMRSGGGSRKDGGGSLGFKPSALEFKDMWRDGRTGRRLLCIINQKQWRKRTSGSAFLDRADCIYAGMEAWVGSGRGARGGGGVALKRTG